METSLDHHKIVELHRGSLRDLRGKIGNRTMHGQGVLRHLFEHPEARIRANRDRTVFLCELPINEVATAVAAVASDELDVQLPKDLPIWEEYCSHGRFFELDNRGTSWDPYGRNDRGFQDGQPAPEGAYRYGEFTNSNNYGYSWLHPDPWVGLNLFAPDSTAHAHFFFVSLPFSHRELDEAEKNVALERQLAAARENLTAAMSGETHSAVFSCKWGVPLHSYTVFGSGQPERQRVFFVHCPAHEINYLYYPTLEALLAVLEDDAACGRIGPNRHMGEWLGQY